MLYSYYPGCSLKSSAAEYDKSARKVFQKLGVEIKEIDDWNCCGAVELSSLNSLLSLAVPARNLVIASRQSDKLVVACNACLSNLLKAKNKIESDDNLREKINGLLTRKYKAVEVKHLLDVLVNDVGFVKIKEQVRFPLNGLKAASYYGCLLVRPSKLVNFDDPDDPQSLDYLVKTLGGESINHSRKTKCCGGGVILTHGGIANNLSKDILLEIKEQGAECIIVTCPLCYLALEKIQAKARSVYKDKKEIPILFFTQLLGLALGISPKELGCNLNLSSLKNIINKITK